MTGARFGVYLLPVNMALLDPTQSTAKGSEMQPLSILGGGAAGLALAHYAHQAGLAFCLYERLGRVGGLCLSYRFGEHRYDSGAHRFHDVDAAVTRDIGALVKLNPVTSPSKIYTAGRFIDFPPSPLNLLWNSSPAEWFRIVVGLWRGRRRRGEAQNFEDLAVSRFGERLARRFLLNYTAKVWGLPADQLSVDVATRRLNGMGIRALVGDLIFQGKKAAHLDGHFLYPEDGFGAISAAMSDGLPPESLKTGHDVSRLECDGPTVRHVHFTSGRRVTVPGFVISTLPLNRLVHFLGSAVADDVKKSAGLLQFRSLRLVFLRLGKARVSDNASIYFPDLQMCVSRVSEPKNRSASLAPPHETSLVVEVPCSEGEELLSLPETALKERVVSEICRTGLIRPSDVLGWTHHLLPDAYPIYSLDYKLHLETVLEGLRKFRNLITVGRNGRFFYSHLHDQLRTGKETVAALSNACHPAI